LLHGVDLAEACHLMTRVGDHLEEIGDEGRKLPLDSKVAQRLLKANTPVPMEDLGGDNLSEFEADLLSAFNCQMAVPIIVKGELEGALFLHKDLAGKDYGASEVLALDLLGRKLAFALSEEGEGFSNSPREDSAGGSGESSEQLSRKIHQQRALFKIGKEFNSTRDEDHLISLVLLTTIAQVGVGSVAWFELENGKLIPRKQRGLDEAELSEIVVEAPEHLRQLGAAAGLRAKAPADELQGIFDQLAEFGFEFVAPLRGKAKMFGLLAMGPRLGGSAEEAIDDEFLIILLNQAGVALENAILIRDLHDRTLGVAQTFVNLIEKRSGPGARASTELISHYVGQVAKAINFPTDQIRDLVYGTVLRDIGMIEISDLVLRSPRSLSQEEWQLIKQHPLTGVEILSGMDFSATIKDVVLYHHERFNGEGYPHGLRGPAIPLGARIVSVVESFVAMTRDLPYRAALSRGEATEVIKENWGMRYDPEVLQAFLDIVEPEGEEEPVGQDLVGAH
jgi:HD-GYP domain-containing protein (c-di-GMP phosphodiesterase class II)